MHFIVSLYCIYSYLILYHLFISADISSNPNLEQDSITFPTSYKLAISERANASNLVTNFRKCERRFSQHKIKDLFESLYL